MFWLPALTPGAWAALRILGPAVGALLVAGGLWLHGYSTGGDRAEQRHEAERAELMAQALRASEEQRAIETKRHAAMRQEVARARDRQAIALRDAATAAAAADRLRERIAALAACPAGGDPAPTPGGPTATATGDLLADVQRRLDDAAGELAAFADAAHGAGLACQAAYGALITPQSPGATP